MEFVKCVCVCLRERERTRGKYRREREGEFRCFRDFAEKRTNTVTIQIYIRKEVYVFWYVYTVNVSVISYHDSTRGEMLYDVVWPYLIYTLRCLLRLLVEEF